MSYPLSPSLEAKYRAVLDLCMRSPAYYRHRFCGTKNKKVYLKIVTRRGLYFSPEELKIIDQFITQLAGTNRSLSINKETGTLSITFYD